MVNLHADNIKLRGRAARIVAAIAGCDEKAALAALEKTGGSVKPAILLAAGAADVDGRGRTARRDWTKASPGAVETRGEQAVGYLAGFQQNEPDKGQQGDYGNDTHYAYRTAPRLQHPRHRRDRDGPGQDDHHRELAQRRPRHLAGEADPGLRSGEPRHQGRVLAVRPDRIRRGARRQARGRLGGRHHHLPSVRQVAGALQEGSSRRPQPACPAWRTSPTSPSPPGTTDDGSATFCVPMASVIHGFIYNKDAFDKLGIAVPATRRRVLRRARQDQG